MASPLEQGKEIWTRLKPMQRVMVVGAAVATIALVIALVFYYSSDEYGVLFSDLKPTDAQSIVEKLKGSNVAYKLSNNGTTISVPSNRVSELRLQMASSGLLSGGHVGFDLFDKTSFGATDFAQQVNYQRAIEGELSRTLEGIEEVESARVHITKARESIYADKQEKAKASVMLRVRQNRELSKERTESVVSLIASAVEGLDPSEVSVMDTNGRLLTSGNRNGANETGAFDSQLDAKRKLEAETAARVISMLEPISGLGRVRADVAADVDFSKIEQTEEKYDPKSQVIRSQQTTQELKNSSARTSANAGGVTGTRANDPTTQTPNQPNTTNGDSRMATTTNYEIDKIVKHTIGNSGRISRLSVSVLVDHKVVNGVSVARTPEELKKIQDVVSAAVGIDSQRGDQIVVQTMPFDQPATETTNASLLQRNRDLINTLIKYIAPVIIVLLFLLFVVRPAKKALNAAFNPATELMPASANGAPLALLEGSADELAEEKLNEQMTPKTVAEMEAALSGEHPTDKLATTDEINRRDGIKQELIERIKEDPDLMAMTVRSWLNEEN